MRDRSATSCSFERQMRVACSNSNNLNMVRYYIIESIELLSSSLFVFISCLFLSTVLCTHLTCLGCLSRTMSLLVVNKTEESVVVLHLPIRAFKNLLWA